MKHILSDNDLRFIYTWRKSWEKKFTPDQIWYKM